MSGLTGCATTTPSRQLEQLSFTNQDIARCRAFYNAFDRQIETANVHDIQTQAIADFPYLHVNRFLATYKPKLTHKTRFNAWLERTRQLALRTQAIEWKNLSGADQTHLTQVTQTLFGYQASVARQLPACSSLLSQQELSDTSLRQAVYQRAVVTSDYQTWQRIVGLYAVTALPFARGIHNWHTESTHILQQPYDSLVFEGKAERYLPPATTNRLNNHDIATLIKQTSENPLDIPQFNVEQLKVLFNHFAPIIEIDTRSNDDRPGAAMLDSNASAQIDINKPTVYTLLSYTLLSGKVLPQFNYIVWFPARTCTSIFDMLCGKLDGIIWRVTVATNGTALHYDMVHDCGCYHTFFPTAQLHKRPAPDSLEEWAFTPMEAPTLKENQRMRLTLNAGAHYIVSLNASNVTNQQHPKNSIQTTTYAFTDYNELRSLPLANSHARGSLFGTNGIIAGTQRGERFLFWPMGIPSPGAMRQWGHHATAFVGRRYFDDPCLLEDYYTPALSIIKPHSDFHPPTMPDAYCGPAHKFSL